MNKILTTLLALFISTQFLYCNAKKDLFSNFPNHYFIETGSYIGGGIQLALDSGYKEIYSIEILNKYYQQCKKRFVNNPNVHLILGDAVHSLPKLLKKIDKPCTFWLDAHFCSYDPKRNQKNYKALTTSLKKELLAIKNHHIKTHTILIDDMRLLGTQHMEYLSKKSIVRLVQSINRDYKIYYVDGSFKGDVLVATISTTNP